MNYFKIYANFLKKFIKLKKPMRVVFDASGGAAGLIIKNLNIKNLEFFLINKRPDGNFSSHSPNPLDKGAVDQLKKEVKKRKANLGVIFDADGDRVFFVDDNSEAVNPNEIGYILMEEFKPPFAVTVASSELLKKQKVVFCRTGHYFFKKLMREKKISFGAEPSGHFYFKDFFYCDSGILAAIKLINFISALNVKFSEYLNKLPKYYRSEEINIKLAKDIVNRNKVTKEIFKKIERIYEKEAIKVLRFDGLTMNFSDWWFNIRVSDTENLLRLNVESLKKETIAEKTIEIRKLIESLVWKCLVG